MLARALTEPLTLRYERRADIYLAFDSLGCALFCLNQLRRFC